MRSHDQFASTASYGLANANESITIAATFIHGDVSGITLTYTRGDEYGTPVTVSTSHYNHGDSGDNVTHLLALITALSPILGYGVRNLMLDIICYLHDPEILTACANDLNAGTIPYSGMRVFLLPDTIP